MSKSYPNVSKRRPKRSAFDLSHRRLQTVNFGELIPTMFLEVVPGDYFSGAQLLKATTAPILGPVMHNINIFTHYFFVPYRLCLTENSFEQFITQKHQNAPNVLFNSNLPRVLISKYATKNYSQPGPLNLYGSGSLLDHLGFPVHRLDTSVNTGQAIPTIPSGYVRTDQYISAMPFLAYQKIWKDWYRDQDLQPVSVNNDPAQLGAVYTTGTPAGSVGIMADPNNSTYELLRMRSRCWEHDYFTANRPSAQQGLPIVPDVSTVASLRQSIVLQEFLEKVNRAGGRYIEWLQGIFGSHPRDERLQRPEYLGGGSQSLGISTVLQTSSSTQSPLTYQANQAGYAHSSGFSHFNRKFTEYGCLIAITSCMPRTMYYQGTPRHFLRTTPSEFYKPDFQGIGDQSTYNLEVLTELQPPATGSPPLATYPPQGTFGYNPRNAEYKFQPDSCTGDFRTTLDFFHLGRKYTSATPVLNNAFVDTLESIPSNNRIFGTVTSGAGFTGSIWLEIANSVKAVRPMLFHGDPGGLTDHSRF